MEHLYGITIVSFYQTLSYIGYTTGAHLCCFVHVYYNISKPAFMFSVVVSNCDNCMCDVVSCTTVGVVAKFVSKIHEPESSNTYILCLVEYMTLMNLKNQELHP